jgi:hypothetical protein
MPTLDTTWGGTAANAYITVVYVDTYAEEKPFTGIRWINDTDEDRKTACVLQATRDIDGYNWKFEKRYWNQNLEFPRSLGDITQNYIPLDPAFNLVEYIRMQKRTEQACAEQALFIYSNRGVNDPVRTHQEGKGGKSESIGRLSESWNLARVPHILCQEALTLLRDFRGTARIIRG